MTKVEMSHVYEHAPHLVDADLGAAIALLCVENGIYTEVAGASKAVWIKVDGHSDVSAIVAALLAQYDIDEATCAAQTFAFLSQALQKRLIRRVR